MRKINEIIIHCSATRPSWMNGKSAEEKVAEIRRWHVQDRGWSDIGYHYIIDRDGKVVEGRPVERAGAHTKGRNKNTIGVCLIGGHGSAKTDPFMDNFTHAQRMALLTIIIQEQKKASRFFPGMVLKVSGHNQYASKACPGFNVPAFMKGAKKPSPFSAILEIIKAIFGGRK